MIARTKHDVRDYILEADREDPSPTVFKVGTLTVRQKAAVMRRMPTVALTEDGDNLAATGDMTEAALEAVRLGIVGWENLRDRNGELVPCKRRAESGGHALTPESLDVFSDMTVVMELFGQIMRENQLDEDDLGNSLSSPRSPADEVSTATA